MVKGYEMLITRDVIPILPTVIVNFHTSFKNTNPLTNEELSTCWKPISTNTLNLLWGNKMVHQAEAYSLLGEDQFGARPGCTPMMSPLGGTYKQYLLNSLIEFGWNGKWWQGLLWPNSHECDNAYFSKIGIPVEACCTHVLYDDKWFWCYTSQSYQQLCVRLSHGWLHGWHQHLG